MARRLACSLVFLLAVGFWAAYGSVISYYCITDGTIWVMNPNTTMFLSATASNNETVCTLEMSDDLYNITISGCDKLIHIALTLSSRNSSDATSDGIIGGDAYSETYLICCGEIPDEGVMFTRGLYVDVQAETVVGTVTQPAPVTEEPVTPSFSIKSSIWNYADTQVVTSGVVSEELRWKIIGPEEYDILPLSCTAYSGTTVGGSPNQVVSTNGCAEDDSLVANFVSTESEQYSLEAPFYVFKFYNSAHLTLACTVRTCPRTSSSCNLSCGGRKKRQGTYAIAAPDDVDNDDIKESLVVAHIHVFMTAGASFPGPVFHAVTLSLLLSGLGLYHA